MTHNRLVTGSSPAENTKFYFVSGDKYPKSVSSAISFAPFLQNFLGIFHSDIISRNNKVCPHLVIMLNQLLCL